MTGYTKLFGSIISSTIWRESKETKIVWITMLAMSNQFGEVEGSVPGLAVLAGVTTCECESALAALLAPDQYSRTQDHDGRRIEPIDGGWRLLNHAKYRAKMNEDDRREYLRRKQQEQRDKRKNVNRASTNVNKRQPVSTTSTHSEADSDSKAEANKEKTNTGAARFKIPTLEEIKLTCSKGGIPESDGEWFFYKCEGNGWKNSGQSIKNWWMTLKSWQRAGYLPSQKPKGFSKTQNQPPRGPSLEEQEIAALRRATDKL